MLPAHQTRTMSRDRLRADFQPLPDKRAMIETLSRGTVHRTERGGLDRLQYLAAEWLLRSGPHGGHTHRIDDMLNRLGSIGSTVLVVTALLLSKLADAQGMGPMPVVVETVVERDLPPTLRLVGTVRPDRFAVVAAEVAGRIDAFVADEGQAVKAGDVIARVEAIVPTLRRDEARATLAALRARLAELEQGERPEELSRIEAMIGEGNAMVAKWKFEAERTKALYESNSSSEKERVDAAAELAAAQRRVAQMEAQLDMARKPRPEVVLRVRQEVAAQEAVLARFEHDVEKTAIRAPFDAVITSKRSEAGAWIEVGGPVAEIISLTTVRVRVDVPENAIAFARVGAPASLEIEALGKDLTATISRCIPLANSTARTFPVEIDVPNSDRALFAGLFVWAQVPAGPTEKRLMVSKDALVARGGSKQIFVIRTMAPDQPPMAMPLPVKAGLEVAGQVAVQADGLKAGDQVVVRANERLYGPMPVLPRAVGEGEPGTPPSSAPAGPGGPSSRPGAVGSKP